MTAETMTEAQFARHRGVSKTSVTNWKRRGFLVWDDKLIRVDASEALLDARPRQYRGGTATGGRRAPASAGDEAPPPDFTDAANWTTAEACRRKEIALAMTRSIAVEKLRGNIILATDMEPGWARQMQVIRTAILAIPGRARMQLQLDATQTEGLRKIVHEVLRAVASGAAPQSTGRKFMQPNEFADLDTTELWLRIIETMEAGLAASDADGFAPAAPFREAARMFDELVRREPEWNCAAIAEMREALARGLMGESGIGHA